MSSDEQQDELSLLPSYHDDYAASEPGSSPHRIKTGKSRLTEAQKLRDDAIKHLNIDPITYPLTLHRKRHVSKKSLFTSSHDDISMSTSLELTDDALNDEERTLIPKLPGQLTDDINVPTRQVFEYVYRNFTDPNSRKYLEDIQPWLQFRRKHNRIDHSIPVLDYIGNAYPDLINWTLPDIDSLPINAQKLQQIQQTKKTQHVKSVPIDTSKTSQSVTSTSKQTSTTDKTQPVSISHTLATTINKNTGTSGTPPPSPPTPHKIIHQLHLQILHPTECLP